MRLKGQGDAGVDNTNAEPRIPLYVTLTPISYHPKRKIVSIYLSSADRKYSQG